ncbi:predicted protein, partial [Nematostella vectensis]
VFGERVRFMELCVRDSVVGEQARERIRRLWEPTYTITYREARDPNDQELLDREKVRESSESPEFLKTYDGADSRPGHKDEHEAQGTRKTSRGGTTPKDDLAPVVDILQLLRLLNAISVSSAQHFGKEGKLHMCLPQSTKWQ